MTAEPTNQAPTNGGPPTGGPAPAQQQPAAPQPVDPLSAEAKQVIEQAILHGAQAAQMADNPQEFDGWATGVKALCDALAGPKKPPPTTGIGNGGLQ
jgi:hypothetical protein